jgi:gas vesicle protein
MYDEDAGGALNFIAGVMVGAVLGAGIGMLLAPQSGRRTRKQIRRAVDGAREDALGRWDDVTDDLRDVVESSRKRLKL